jgi:hypothetical protein
LLVNTSSNPFFTDTSTDLTGVSGVFAAAGADAATVGTTTDTIYFDPSLLGDDFGLSLTSVPGVGTDVAPTVTEDLITPLGSFPLGDLLGGDSLTSLLGGGSDGLGSMLTGGDLLTGLDPFLQVLTAF